MKCPECGFEADTPQAEVAHMEREHPDVIAARLHKAGFRLIDGKWVDTLSGDTEWLSADS